ncbi:uncharacterized protein BO80DRAFT_167440 [Aspergillus ibericus CBS 121593]|uniref:Uncharacterized protein n=1 Tax=Aspergillus ibericus CBS 121593 TaxID=1448316 RepID=A0A395GRZ4_9EURO|nr:hypothetical protein BO80DRAFT_167440 [Aspergillus ibericus CBS 121593]RAK97994.1 hypothetical protein BO80DRAFT_167440 [Aspergillus ibericus CBS 121593]
MSPHPAYELGVSQITGTDQGYYGRGVYPSTPSTHELLSSCSRKGGPCSCKPYRIHGCIQVGTAAAKTPTRSIYVLKMCRELAPLATYIVLGQCQSETPHRAGAMLNQGITLQMRLLVPTLDLQLQIPSMKHNSNNMTFEVSSLIFHNLPLPYENNLSNARQPDVKYPTPHEANQPLDLPKLRNEHRFPRYTCH